MYMSYCRFEGTNAELNACLNVVQEHINEEAEFAVSSREIDYFEDMIRTVHAFMIDNEILDCAGDIDEDALQEILYKMRKTQEEAEE